MNLDKRIKSLSDVLTCFDIEKAKQFKGEKGYFADALGEFKNLKGCKYGELVECECDSYYPYWCRARRPGYAFYIPESILKLEEKKYRPFDPTTFEQHYDIGSVIEYRRKDDKNRIYKETIELNARNYNLNEFYVEMGEYTYTLDELFEDFELFENGEWKPFGVEE